DAETVEIEIDDRRRIQGEHLADDQSTDDRDAQRPAQLRAVAAAQRERYRGQQRRHRRHHDRAEAQQTGLEYRFARLEAPVALGVEREVDHHDRVLLDDPDQQYDADQRNDTEVGLEQQQREQRTDAGRRQRGQDRKRVHVAFIEDAQHDIDGQQGGEDQPGLAVERGLERLRGSLEAAAYRRGNAKLRERAVDGDRRLAQRRSLGEIERDRRGDELRLVVDAQRGVGRRVMRDRRQ